MQTTRDTEGCGKVMGRLYMALELSLKKWVVLFSDGNRRRRVVVEALDRVGLREQMVKAKAKFGLPEDAPVMSCLEAGRDGHWIHRWLLSEGIDNREVDSASLAVSGRAKRVKTDRVDVEQLLGMLLRVGQGESGVWREVRVPPVAAEDDLRLYRERGQLLKERTAHRNRIGSLLNTQGIRVEVRGDFEQTLSELRCWDGNPLGAGLRDELQREWTRYQVVCEQLRALEQAQAEALKAAASTDEGTQQMQRLILLRGVGTQSAWVLVRELLGWRDIRNRRELAALVGLTPTPYASGNSEREQGISKAGNRRVRAALIELAWGWLRYQPDSALSHWFQSRFGGGGKRNRRVGIVALARKLLIALWRWSEQGVVPEGAVVKA